MNCLNTCRKFIAILYSMYILYKKDNRNNLYIDINKFLSFNIYDVNNICDIYKRICNNHHEFNIYCKFWLLSCKSKTELKL